ncbi:MAG: riboflavin synthase [Nodosilinea sp. LVE1205-7]|jgi:riboflavin synthase
MFTGLIQARGELYHRGHSQLQITLLEPVHPLLRDIHLGDSIAVDGICLTVAEVLPQGFVAEVSPETLARSTLGQLPEGHWVNLESALRVGGKVGGHFVTGHVDGLGALEMAMITDNAWRLSFTIGDRQVTPYIVAKGSIAINGISLTIAECNPVGDWFAVAVIPVTYQETTLAALKPGESVNLEADILGKYVEKLLTKAGPALDQGLSFDFLANHGY